LPPISLPTDARVHFLATAGEIYAEGEKMGHCIGSYAERAIAGRCYLFHVDYGDRQASVEVDPFGWVKQAFGPYNEINAASDWGRQVLAVWASQFPNHRDGMLDPLNAF
jgi:hypothetical protein